MRLEGNAWVFGDDIDTDQIYPGPYLTLTDPDEMAKHAMEGVPGFEDFTSRVEEGDFIVAGRNFGSGSSREHAPVAIRRAGVSAIIAKSFARIFYRNAVNLALPILECSEVDQIETGDRLRVDIDTGEIENITRKRTLEASPVSGLEQEIMQSGGLLPFLKARRSKDEGGGR